MLGKLPELYYNFSSKPLDPDFLYVKNIWRRAQIFVEYKNQIVLFTEETVGDGERPKTWQQDYTIIHFIIGLY